jgi:chromate transporter
MSVSASAWSLFLAFLRLGVTAFGGPAMIAHIRVLAVEKKRWIDEQAARDGIALCQAIPGATAMQMSAYVGLRAGGLAGAAASFVGFGLPAFVLMTALSALYVQSHEVPTVVSAFNGLQVIVVAIVANATLTFGRASLKTWRHLVNALAAAAMFAARMTPILVVFAAGLMGLVLYPKRQHPRSGESEKGSSSGKVVVALFAGIALGYALLFLLGRRLFELATLMSKVDLFAFGGGFSSVPLMFHEVVEVRSWLDGPTLLNGIALGQVTPGPIVITATFIGYLLHGVAGALVATIGVFLPSFLILVTVVPFFDRIRSARHFDQVLTGILCSFVGLLSTVTVRFASNIPWEWPRFLITLAAFVALVRKVDILWVVVVGALVSMAAL